MIRLHNGPGLEISAREESYILLRYFDFGCSVFVKTLKISKMEVASKNSTKTYKVQLYRVRHRTQISDAKNNNLKH